MNCGRNTARIGCRETLLLQKYRASSLGNPWISHGQFPTKAQRPRPQVIPQSNNHHGFCISDANALKWTEAVQQCTNAWTVGLRVAATLIEVSRPGNIMMSSRNVPFAINDDTGPSPVKLKQLGTTTGSSRNSQKTRQCRISTQTTGESRCRLPMETESSVSEDWCPNPQTILFVQ